MLRGKKSLSDVIFDWGNILFLLLLAFVTLYPFWNILVYSINESMDASKGGLYFWPRSFVWQNYEQIFNMKNIYNATLITIERTVLGTAISVFCTVMLAYTLSRKDYIFLKPITTIFLLTMYLNGGLIPTYMLIRGLGMVGTFWVYIIPGLIGAFNLIIIRTFIHGLPAGLIESARIDGAGDFGIFIKIVFPLCMPVIATISLFTAVGHWNSWFDVFLYNSNIESLSTLQYELMKVMTSATSIIQTQEEMVKQGGKIRQVISPESIRAAMTIVATVPIVIVYPFLQKYFVKGVMVGGIKE